METSDEGKSPHSIGESPGYILWQSAMHWQRSANKVLSAFDLTYTQYIVLAIACRLHEQKLETYQHLIAKFARIDRMMTSRVIANLEQKNFIKRLKKRSDARTNLVQLTPEGKKVIKKAIKAVEELENAFFLDGKISMNYSIQN